MEKREDRRARTYWYVVRTYREWLRVVPKSTLPSGYFVKGKSVGCRCRRHRPGRPRVVQSICHGGNGYHPSVRERIDGKRLCRDWGRELLAEDPDDIEL
jgi:hypothetical protein